MRSTKKRKRLYYSTGEILKLTGLKRHQLETLESKGFISPLKVERGRKYYSGECINKLRKVKILLEDYSLEVVIANFEKLEAEVKLKHYKRTLMEVKTRIENILNGHLNQP